MSRNMQEPRSNKPKSSVYSQYALGWPLEYGAWCAAFTGKRLTSTTGNLAIDSGARLYALNWVSRPSVIGRLFLCPGRNAGQGASNG